MGGALPRDTAARMRFAAPMLDALILLWLAALPLMGSPGPATLSLAAMGTAFGMPASLPYLAGICLGTAAVLVAVASGFVGLLFAVPAMVPVVTGAAALYIVYLAVRIATAPPLNAARRGASAPSLLGGLALAIANPKAYAAIGAVYSSVQVVPSDPLADATVKVAALCLVIVSVNSLWLGFGSVFSRVLQTPRAARVANVSFAVLLVLSVGLAVLS